MLDFTLNSQIFVIEKNCNAHNGDVYKKIFFAVYAKKIVAVSVFHVIAFLKKINKKKNCRVI